jgi:hypothetical protein
MPLAIKLPRKLKLASRAGVFLYFPDMDGVALSSGKDFGGGLFSLSPIELRAAAVTIPGNGTERQFLLIIKNPKATEAVANIYFRDGIFENGPFVSADYRMSDEDGITISAATFSPERYVAFEIEGVPESAGLSKGRCVSDTVWEVPARDAKSFALMLPGGKAGAIGQIRLAITASDKRAEGLKTTFNLVIPLKKPSRKPRREYREMKIDAGKILRDGGLKAKDCLLRIRLPDGAFCVKGAAKAKDKWILGRNAGKIVTVDNFDMSKDTLDLALEFIALNPDGSFETYVKKLACDFRGSLASGADFVKCISCRNASRCAMFGEFMEYIGNSTILRHIAGTR